MYRPRSRKGRDGSARRKKRERVRENEPRNGARARAPWLQIDYACPVRVGLLVGSARGNGNAPTKEEEGQGVHEGADNVHGEPLGLVLHHDASLTATTVFSTSFSSGGISLGPVGSLRRLSASAHVFMSPGRCPKRSTA